MSALKMMATTLWTQLLEGMRADGIIAHCVTQSGAATTKVIVDTCQAVMENSWLRMSFLPRPDCQVLAHSAATGNLFILTYDHKQGIWLHSDGITIANVEVFDGWRYVHFHAPEQVEVEYAP